MKNTISICHPDLEDIDTVVSELLRFKKEYYDQLNEELANQ